MTKIRFFLERLFSARYDGLSHMAPNKNWVVHYDEGKKSMPMRKGTALDYLQIFKGIKVEKTKGMFRRSIYLPKKELTHNKI